MGISMLRTFVLFGFFALSTLMNSCRSSRFVDEHTFPVINDTTYSMDYNFFVNIDPNYIMYLNKWIIKSDSLKSILGRQLFVNSIYAGNEAEYFILGQELPGSSKRIIVLAVSNGKRTIPRYQLSSERTKYPGLLDILETGDYKKRELKSKKDVWVMGMPNVPSKEYDNVRDVKFFYDIFYDKYNFVYSHLLYYALGNSYEFRKELKKRIVDELRENGFKAELDKDFWGKYKAYCDFAIELQNRNELGERVYPSQESDLRQIINSNFNDFHSPALQAILTDWDRDFLKRVLSDLSYTDLLAIGLPYENRQGMQYFLCVLKIQRSPDESFSDFFDESVDNLNYFDVIGRYEIYHDTELRNFFETQLNQAYYRNVTIEISLLSLFELIE